MARRFTRQAFHDLVWSKPTTQLAKEFAMSDVALHKICRKHGIPTPPVGWWAKQAAGKAVRRTPLPDAQDEAEIVIAGADLTATDVALAGARENARVLASSGTVSSAAAMHPAIGRTLAALRKARPSAQGLVATEGGDHIRCTISPASIDRLADFLPALLSAAAVQGFDLETAEGGVRFRSTTETVTVSISEALDRTPHVKTDAEKAREAAWTKKREESRRRNSWSFLVDDRPVFPEWDYAPSGKLGLELEQVWTRARTGPRRAFRDGKTQTLESMVADIAVGLAVLAIAKTEERLRQEAWKRDYQEEQARREQAARAARVDERRRGALDAILADMDSLDRMRRLMTGLRSEQTSEPDRRVAAFLAWADAEVERRSAGLSADGLEARFRREGLFGDDDDRDSGGHRWM
ncbi:MAG TPA: hypothetical protein PLQ03_06505 [Brevundimonas sp.]|uniref:hypothetical protein n=1 Tax=Brevundimonas sp. TaxID=1871086 RepID=UPI002628F11A|nr:hypothetical protein [Brevundimonas sp.]HRO33048.1 hypothetical protein [Brevundimonas sp.]